MKSAEILKIYDLAQKNKQAVPDTQNLTSILRTPPCIRINSYSIEDAAMGDSGKGTVVAKLNEKFRTCQKGFSMRYNGGANAGHETGIYGKLLITHQLPTGILSENVTAFMGRQMLIHPADLVFEIDSIKRQIGGLPGKLLIDENALLGLDTHRATEYVRKVHTGCGHGSTSRGITDGYVDYLEKTALTMRDLMSEKWGEKFRAHYKHKRRELWSYGPDFAIEDIEVSQSGHKTGKVKVGKEAEFIDRLAEVRSKLCAFTKKEPDILLQKVWDDQSTFITMESAQGPGLDPFHGVWPDVTVSRPLSRFMCDSTYGIFLPECIEMRLAVMKTTYMSSVGSRKLPTVEGAIDTAWIQQEFDECGKSTGRVRDIYPISIPMFQYLRRVAGYQMLVATHLDASKENAKIPVITHYTDKETGEEKPYRPYQHELDRLDAHIIYFDGWNGESARHARTPQDLPENLRIYLNFLSATIAPVIMGTMGPNIHEYISWTDRFNSNLWTPPLSLAQSSRHA